MDWFKAHDIYVGIHYPVPIHLQPAYKKRIYTAERMEVTEGLASSVISLPIYPELSIADVDRIIEVANHFSNG
jgi:dTDP-4-amino-4,6-dideoxygalactose transaminase